MRLRKKPEYGTPTRPGVELLVGRFSVLELQLIGPGGLARLIETARREHMSRSEAEAI